MPDVLVDRLTWPPYFSPEGEKVYREPERQRQIISLLERQIEATRSSARAVGKSNLVSSGIIVAELERQSDRLEMQIERQSADLASAIQAQSMEITSAIADVGASLGIYLGEIQWQLEQQTQTLSGILKVLEKSRSNEARQLVRQGYRHYINREYDEAMERLFKALDYDTTDYQVLMNLGYVHAHIGDVENSRKFFRKALTLPENLDETSRACTLRALARVEYKHENYSSAAAAFDAMTSECSSGITSGDVMNGAIYHCLSEDDNRALYLIRRLVENDDFVWRVTAVPELERLRPQIFEILSELARKRKAEAEAALVRAIGRAEAIHGNRSSLEVAEFVSLLEAQFRRRLDRLNSTAYSEIASVHSSAKAAEEALAHAEELPKLDRKLERLTAVNGDRERRLRHLRSRPAGDHLPLLFISVPIAYVVPALIILVQFTYEFATESYADAGSWGLAMLAGVGGVIVGALVGIIWPITFLFDGSPFGYTVPVALCTFGLFMILSAVVYTRNIEERRLSKELPTAKKDERATKDAVEGIRERMKRVIDDIRCNS